MSALHAVAILAAGFAAGAINTVVGSGTLITFPVLLAFGYAPVTANVSNTIGLVPGSVSGAIGYRSELRGQERRTARLALASLAGGTAGAVLLLTLPASAFKTIVPAFIVVALILIIFQSRIGIWLASRRLARDARGAPRARPDGGIGTLAGVGAAGVYGGYFGAAQGILLLAILGLSLDEPLQRINAMKVVLAGLVNLIAGVIFVFGAHVAWAPVGLIAAGSTLGGAFGARVGRRLPPVVLRAVIVVVGVVAIVRLV
jgi:uncharacterized membrane protein YfcA